MACTRPTGRGAELAEIPPEHCPNGHPLRYPNVLVSHLPCWCAGPGGHRTYRCLTCDRVIYVPPHDETLPAGQGSLYG